jgi:hypothetical protein
MLINVDLSRRSYLKGVSLGAGGVLFAPLLQKVAAAANGNLTPPKRVIFFLFDNGFQESGATPLDWKNGATSIRQESIEGAKLPADIEPLAAFQDRMTLVQGLQGRHCAFGHGSRYGALAGVRSHSPSDPKAETIDAAIAKAMPGIFPMVGLGILAGTNTQTAYGTSAAGAGTPIAIQCRPEAAYQSLFGSIGATGNDFLDRKNLLDFVTKDVRRLQSRIAGPEKELVDFHLGALESLTNRDEQMAKLQEDGLLRRIAPELPNKHPTLMTEIVASQCDIAASALISGLTNVVTITSGVGWINTNYSGISNHKTHSIGHGQKDPATKLSGAEVLKRYRNYLTSQAARLLQKLQDTPEGEGSMLDNTVLVFTSDCANTQHCKGANWPFVLVGDLGGTLKAGQYVSYPMTGGNRIGHVGEGGNAATSNPAINALYTTLLHAVGAPRDAFNAGAVSAELCGPLKELLA